MLEETEDVECAIVTMEPNKESFLNPDLEVNASENDPQQVFSNISLNSTSSSNNENAQGKFCFFFFKCNCCFDFRLLEFIETFYDIISILSH